MSPELASAARRKWVALMLLVLTAALGAYDALRLEVTSDITHFLPDDSDETTARLLRELTTASVAQRMVLVIGGAAPEVLVEASARIASDLERQASIAGVDHRVDDAAQRAIYDLYFPRRYGLYSDAPERDYARLLSSAGLERAAAELVRKLGGAEGPLIRRLAPEDPLLVFPRVLARLDHARQGGLGVREGVFFTNDGEQAVLFVRTKASALDAPAQRSALAAIERAVQDARGALHAPLTLEMSGVGRYSVRAERAIRSDIERISIFSSAVLVVLVLTFLRSFRALGLVLLPTVLGVVAATAATLFAFGRVHGMTLAFGSTLLGVCSDYPVHLLGHHVLGARDRDGSATARHIWPAIRLGGLTTLAGLAGMGLAGFPGIRELSLFSAVGVLASLIATRYVVPVALGRSGTAGPITRTAGSLLARAVAGIERRRALCWGMLALALGSSVVGLSSLRFQDDLASWVPMPEQLRKEDERVSARLLAMDPGKLVVVSGGSASAALDSNDQVAGVLDAAIQRGELGDYRSLHSLLWAPSLQARNLVSLYQVPQLGQRVLEAFDAAGVDPAQLVPFERGLKTPAEPLLLSDLLRSPLAPIASGFVIGDPNAPMILTHLRGVRDPSALQRALAPIANARFFDQRAVLAETYGAFRTRAFELLIGGLFAVLGLVLVRYRSLRRALAAVLPAILASAATLSVLSMAGVALDLFHVLGVLLVLSMGEDYGVFLVESEGGEDMPATALGIALACASTVASFGVLALSDIPALRSLGQVVSIGVLLATVFAPAGLVLLARRPS